MKHVLLVVLLAGSLGGRPVVAQSGAAGRATAAISPSHHRAALAFLNTLYTEATYNQLVMQRLASQLAGQPLLKPYQDVYQAFYLKHTGWSAMREQLADVYAQEFSEAELEQLRQFYETPAGRKYIQQMGSLTQQIIELGQRAVQAYQPELKQALAAKAAALANGATGSAGN